MGDFVSGKVLCVEICRALFSNQNSTFESKTTVDFFCGALFSNQNSTCESKTTSWASSV